MALSAFRLRRASVLSSSVLHRALSAVTSSPPLAANGVARSASPVPLGSQNAVRRSLYPSVQSFSFRTSALLADRRSNSGGAEDSKFGPDDILFEGCDYNHWLITMDFPKDPAPTAEEMVETYVQTLAKVVGSVEEAKKRMYACSTTTYHGFQAVMTEEMSEKFRGLPGVVFILPDSYIDPVNKEYGGDKYDNGVITPRPPPVQYNRQRPRNQNQYRNDRPNYNRPPPQGAPGNMPHAQQGPVQGDGGYYAPQQNYGQPGQGGRAYGESRGRDFVPPGERRNFGPGEQRNYAYPGGRDGFQGERRDPQMSYQRDGNFVPQDQRNFSQGPGGNTFSNTPGYQGQRGGNFVPPEQRNYSQGPVGDNNYAGPSGYGDNNRQVPGPGFDGGYRRQ